ncbi:FMN-dependent NADH-azoreductase [Agrobacterium rosae]|uniref:FMN dependent NADH:quinone oxidoreductase n=1 Tax=Agrobacterium rosae TaxID=1972867 RepID=A0AAE5VQ23_9HYPH|nr:FMN-dependent NADH-azoreductase [Agrobacterium rosae]KAA3512273.1 FMN-dependent NADH-azoreductase [Agrobacterium rosae]KAA3520278.1 FMN-dependent NADH-azoreductase [Agrobacterium rosae]MBN7808140.1 FMN-dependent NADH-azoreductase [Agrobacterium rosae]MCM2432157.1 FMN-dependent NADH-azoreductase [Agrobacterium rosae]MDX8301256.1 FMN-dependent NADH-azoreductase [Agrobacterium rosae]
MSKILLLTSSPRAEESLSNKFAGDLAAKLQAQTNGTITHLDLGQNPIPHLDQVTTSAIRKSADQRDAQEAAAADYSDKRVAELLEADTIVIGTGMINFNIYSGLKSWIDNIARAGLTFKYTESGPVGLATGKKVYIVLSSAGVYSEGPAAAMDHAIPYLKTVLGFIGLTDIEVIRVEGLAFGPEAAEKAIASATAKVEELAKAA